MRFKLIPEPPADLDRVREAQKAVPLVPGDEDDCCARLQRRLDFPSRDISRTWLTFLRALELAEETPSGFKRTSTEPTPEHLQTAFLENVMLAKRTLAELVAAGAEDASADDASADGAGADGAAEPLDADDVFERTREDVSTYERHKNPDTWESVWRDRAANLLGWLAVLGLAKPVDGNDTESDDTPGHATLGDPETAYVPTERGVAVLD